ncbi:hypothetical protein [Spirochaeta isovalerica]|uniref:Uncharacterized membrane protein YraQ (UPF0718 family) n=1 Tax=Spirochaeta isovalerica TaxID=150 RepID=A0A841RH50_9SPIO|nr:hypothetical protein [Spirochaeta isovalerica]MBB6481848.1 uncharacterized membrane protein YraQ (UPF0718 family) [Spirochaeta isovalerica]
MTFLYIITALSLLVSLVFNRKKTGKAILSGAKKLWKITPPFLSVLMGVSVVLYLVPQEMISRTLGGSSNFASLITASLIGSITFMPGPIVYPLCRILVNQGVAYSIIAAFSTTLMMVGAITFPMEKSLFGWKFALMRNLVSYCIGLAIAAVFFLVQGVLI